MFSITKSGSFEYAADEATLLWNHMQSTPWNELNIHVKLTPAAQQTDFQSAGQRSCSVQHNDCARAANSGGGFTVNQCDTQQTQCVSAQASATQQNFAVLTSSNADFDFFCDP
jgi:hypothetical protein